jgi:hypothetical protein
MKMQMNVENMRRHVDQLSKAFDIGMVFDRSLDRETAAAVRLKGGLTQVSDRSLRVRERIVITRPIDEETSYAVAVHELGHHLAPNGYCDRPRPPTCSHPRELFEWAAAKLVAEEAAWEWAQYYIEQVFYWTVAMEQTKQYAFGTYLRFRRTGR